MRIIVPFLFLISATMALGQPKDLRLTIKQQLQQSCMTTATYTKEVTDLTDTGATPEKISQPFPGDTLECSLPGDLAYATEIYAWNPKQLEFFTQTQQGDTLISQINPERPDANDLKTQKIVYQEGNVRYLESILRKNYWLYENKVRIRVFFDEKGRYTSHTLWVHTQVILIDNSLKMILKGNASY